MQLNYGLFDSYAGFESARMQFRKFTEEDADDLFLLRTNDEVMKYVDTQPLASIEEAGKMIESFHNLYAEKNGIVWAVIEKETDEFMGHFSIFNINHKHCRVEVGYIIMQKFWNKGYMTEALQKMIPVAFDKINAHSIEANVNPYNTASIKLLEKTGFKKEAYFRENYLFNGKFLDSVIYSLLEKDFIRL